ncbi:YdeI/OmpD-associated family protein [Flavobacterium sp. SUN052]|uniref:YdeI/OmpD-associated family protein n=1 Tax=Flavobacterium sp. SUN052 TaxID=3002441 RepID=UPI00237DA5E0|nr:YdeI/OmpD-associated family protein [Flavobacterium sp. SUN052]MEC4003681.1 YdeI/OmpD-associated family protein [Flavobacterium sp. SUN052]
MEEKLHLYFKNDQEWREWLHENHNSSKGIYLIFYRVNSGFESMRWEEAVRVALCYGWIDSTVRKVDDERRKQMFGPRKEKSGWSKINKNYIDTLIATNLMHQSGLRSIEIAKQNGSWELLDNVENLEIPTDLQIQFETNKMAFENYQKFSFHYRKSYLYWLNQAKREETRTSRIAEIIRLCEQNIKTRH